MEIIEFNLDFVAFMPKEDILVDTGVILGLLNPYDSWHHTVKTFFDIYVLDNNDIALYTHSGLVNEITHLADKPIERYGKVIDSQVTEKEIRASIDNVNSKLYDFIDNDVFSLLECNKRVVLNSILLSREYGSIDALTVSLVNEYGISLMTVDNRLVERIDKEKDRLKNIVRIYYSSSKYRTY